MIEILRQDRYVKQKERVDIMEEKLVYIIIVLSMRIQN